MEEEHLQRAMGRLVTDGRNMSPSRLIDGSHISYTRSRIDENGNQDELPKAAEFPEFEVPKQGQAATARRPIAPPFLRTGGRLWDRLCTWLSDA